MGKSRNRNNEEIIEDIESIEDIKSIKNPEGENFQEEILPVTFVETKIEKAKYKIESIRNLYFICSDSNGNGIEILKNNDNDKSKLGEYLYK